MSFAAGVLQPRARCAWHALGRQEDCFRGGVDKLSLVGPDSTCGGAACLQNTVCCHRRSGQTHGAVTRAKTFSEFGAPQRRVTDSLLIFNAVMFAAQLLTKQGLTAAGAKVRHAFTSPVGIC